MESEPHAAHGERSTTTVEVANPNDCLTNPLRRSGIA